MTRVVHCYAGDRLVVGTTTNNTRPPEPPNVTLTLLDARTNGWREVVLSPERASELVIGLREALRELPESP